MIHERYTLQAWTENDGITLSCDQCGTLVEYKWAQLTLQGLAGLADVHEALHHTHNPYAT